MPPRAIQTNPRPTKRGGKRPGAGRKPNLAKPLLKGVTRDTIVAAVQDIDVGGVTIGLLKSKRDLVRLQTLASLPREAPEALAHAYDELLARYAPNVLRRDATTPCSVSQGGVVFCAAGPGLLF